MLLISCKLSFLHQCSYDHFTVFMVRYIFSGYTVKNKFKITVDEYSSVWNYSIGKVCKSHKMTGADTVDSLYLAPVGSQSSRARVKWFSRYLALSREGHDSRIQDHRPILPGVYNSQTVCWAIIEVLTFPGSLHTSTSHQRQIITSNIRF